MTSRLHWAPGRRATTRWAAAHLGLVLLATQSWAQEPPEERFAVDSVLAADITADRDGSSSGLLGDVVASFRAGRGFQLMGRPVLQRIASTGEWNAQAWLAAVRFEHGRSVAFRIDAGYIPAPQGIANVLLRPHANATIALPAALFTPLPTLDRGAPRVTLLGPVYPLGIAATVSSLRWDVRAAIIDSSPLRIRRVFSNGSPPNPPRLPNVVAGGSLTPFLGARLGGSITHGPWERAGDRPLVTATRMATIVTLDAEVAYRHTRVQAEWTHDRMAVGAGTVSASGWFVQGEHAVTPRVFVAGRVEQLRAPIITSGLDTLVIARDLRTFHGTETTVGYRLSPELVVRASHRLRRSFAGDSLEQQVAVSLVWWRRWR